MIKAGAVAKLGTKPASGAKITARTKQIPTVKAVRPVLPPALVPAVD